MRAKLDPQIALVFSEPTTKITREYYEKYQRISEVLDATPDILAILHEDLKQPLKYASSADKGGRSCRFTTDNVLRILIVMIIESMSLRRVVVLIDDSEFLRRFTRIHDRGMMDFTTLDKLKNSVRPETWKRVNSLLTVYAYETERISGDRLRVDTTAVETNIHHPTDSSLLWDCYRVLARLITQARELDPATVGDRRLQRPRAKKIARDIGRLAGKKKSRERMKPLYAELLRLVGTVLAWAKDVRSSLLKSAAAGKYELIEGLRAEGIAETLAHYIPLAEQVSSQAMRRVLEGEQVPNDEKLFSLFEEHTELLKRGKVPKEIEFGHMIQIQQVREKFITDYQVFPERPNETLLLLPCLEQHKGLFGHYPETLTADKGYYDGARIEALEDKVDNIAIGKKGKRTPEQTEREHSAEFRSAQRFRAGIEGSISFLKRVLGLFRCFNKGWKHFAATVGMTVFTHNLLKLAVP